MGATEHNGVVLNARIEVNDILQMRVRQRSEPNESGKMRSQLLTVRQVAEWLNVSPSWVRDHAAHRRRPVLPAIKLGKSWRFRDDQVAEWIRQLSEQRVI
jgi:excisionase family DNA binding protein